jgi:nitrite reductase/ring-hydroxylating ferredoxin subunit
VKDKKRTLRKPSKLMEWIKIFDSGDEARAQVSRVKLLKLSVNGQKICLTLVDNQFRAFSDRCPHNGESLSKGKINYLGEVICPWHGYRYNTQTGQCSEGTGLLDVFPLRDSAEGVFIAI